METQKGRIVSLYAYIVCAFSRESPGNQTGVQTARGIRASCLTILVSRGRGLWQSGELAKLLEESAQKAK